MHEHGAFTGYFINNGFHVVGKLDVFYQRATNLLFQLTH